MASALTQTGGRRGMQLDTGCRPTGPQEEETQQKKKKGEVKGGLEHNFSSSTLYPHCPQDASDR